MVNLKSEKEIEKVIIKYFEKEGWENKKKKKTHGVDIRLFHNKWRKYWFIEVKREPTNKDKKSAAYNNTAAAIGQIIYRMRQKRAGFYGIAFPDMALYRKELNKIPLWIKKKLKLNIFLINKFGKVRKITPSKEIK